MQVGNLFGTMNKVKAMSKRKPAQRPQNRISFLKVNTTLKRNHLYVFLGEVSV